MPTSLMKAVPPRQHALVGRGRMRVGADHAARAPVDEVAHRLLLAGGLGVEVDQDGVGALLEAAGLDLALDGAERVSRAPA